MSGALWTFKDQFLAVSKLKEIFSVALPCFSSCSPPAFLPVNYFSIFYVECRCIGYDVFSWLGFDGLKSDPQVH